MNTKKLKKSSELYYYLYIVFVLIDFGLILSALLAIIQGPVISSVLGYAEKSWQFGVLATVFMYVVPLLVATTLARIFHFLWGREKDSRPQLSQRTRISSYIVVVFLTVLLSVLFKRIFLTPMPSEYFMVTLCLIPVMAIITIFTFGYTFVKNNRKQIG